jgi:hypothetical protein
MSSPTPELILVGAGCALLLIGVVGGQFTSKYITIHGKLTKRQCVVSGIAGSFLLVLGFFWHFWPNRPVNSHGASEIATPDSASSKKPSSSPSPETPVRLPGPKPAHLSPKVAPTTQAKEQTCGTGSICNQDSPNLGTQEVYNYGPKIPQFLGIQGIMQDPRGNPYPLTDNEGHALTNVEFYADAAWNDPRILVFCDRPCTAYQAIPFQYKTLIMPTFSFAGSTEDPNFVVFIFETIKPMSADTYYVLTVASKDSTPVKILKVAPFLGKLPPH